MHVSSWRATPDILARGCSFSEPAKSTKLNLHTDDPRAAPHASMQTVKTACDREDVGFTLLSPAALCAIPVCKTAKACDKLQTWTVVNPGTEMAPSLSSRTSSLLPVFPRLLDFLRPEGASRHCAASCVERRSNTCSLYTSAKETWNCAVGTLCSKCSRACTMIPRLDPSSSSPNIVWVLPLPVWPYAKTVPLDPSATASTTGITALKTSA
mmetsp:Transcript_18195/g.42331  ORF Transcript_18195/g.42331 Transcript_18195/m.42331 type:complete len:211 (-) Transcript_18195:313-945(-)